MLAIMALLLVFCLIASLQVCSAQSTLASSASLSVSTGTSTSSPSIHTITVARKPHAFDPQSITASPGDLVVFKFWPKDHSVIKGDHKLPCVPFDTVNPGQPSFFSGNFTADTIDESDIKSSTWNLTITDTNPVFFYCGAPNSCNVYKMIGVINPNSTYTLKALNDSITRDTQVLQPGQYYDSEASSTTSAVSSTTSSATSTTTTSTSVEQVPAAATSTALSSSESSSHVSLSTGAIVGIAIGGAVIIALVGALFWYMGRSRVLKQTLEQERNSGFVHPPKGPSSSAYGGDSDGRWSASYAGSPAPDKRTAQPMETVYDIDRHGSPELEGWSAPEIGAVAGYPTRGRTPHRSSVTSELWSEANSNRGPRTLQTRPSVHELG